MIPSDCHPAVPPLLWTLDQSRFSHRVSIHFCFQMIHLMTSLHQQLVNFYLLIIIQFMGISQSLSMSADHFFFSSPEQNPKSKLQRETRKQGGRKRRGGRRAVKGRGSDSKPHSCPPARQHGVTELANTLNQKMQLPCKTKVLAFTSW